MSKLTSNSRMRRRALWLGATIGSLLLAAPLAIQPQALAAPAPKPTPAPKGAKPAAKPPAKPATKPGPELYGPPESPGAVPLAPSAPAAPAEAKSLVRDIQVRGNRRVSDDRIMLSVPITVGDRVGRSDVLDAIQRIYGMGYFQDVKADAEPMPGGERLIFNVVENPLVTDVAFDGVTKVELAKLRENFKPVTGDVLNYNAFKAASEATQKLYADAGFPLARIVDMQITPQGILRLKIAEGRIAAVKVSGNEETKDYVVLREVTTKPGEIFNSERINADLRRIYNLNYFEAINLKYEQAPGDPEAVVVVIDVKEKQTGSINLGAGYSTRDGILGMFTVKKDNLFGTGQQVGLDLSISQQLRFAGELTYMNPWFMGDRTGLGTSLYMRRFNNFLADFREDRLGGSVNITRGLLGDPLTTPWRGSFGLRGEQISIFENRFYGGEPKPGVTLTDIQNGTLGGADTILGATLGLSYDTRDILINPTDGWFNSLSVDPGAINFSTPIVRATGSISRYFPLPAPPWSTERSAIAINMRAGLINTLGSRVPAYERFFSTGPYLIRGWPEFVTPGSPIAQAFPTFFSGSNVLTGTLEYRFPVFNVVSGAVFGDTGLFWDQDFRTDYLHSGYGLGLRMNTPLGPIRLDYGLRELDFAQGQFHFGIGQKF